MTTYKWSSALSVLSKQIRRDVENELGEYIVNMANSRIWNAFDWRESIAKLPPFFLIPEVQDYAKPLLAVPNDFYGLRQAELVNTDGTPPIRKRLHVVQDLLETHVEGIPNDISYEKSRRGFRLNPRPASSLSCTSWMVDGTYKIRPAKVLSNQFNSTALPYDDSYFDVVVTALQWAYAKATADQRTPQLLQELQAMIGDMASKEGFNLGDPVIAPSEPLIGVMNWSSWWPGV